MLGIGLRSVTEITRFKVGENLPTVNQDASIGDALTQAKASEGSRRAGAMLLVDADGRLSGIFTDGDLRRLLLEHEHPMDETIGEVATLNPMRLNTSSLVRDAKQMVTEYRIDEIPIVDDDNYPVALIDVQDLIALKVVQE